MSSTATSPLRPFSSPKLFVEPGYARSLGQLLEEAIDESFPASDPPAIQIDSLQVGERP